MDMPSLGVHVYHIGKISNSAKLEMSSGNNFFTRKYAEPRKIEAEPTHTSKQKNTLNGAKYESLCQLCQTKTVIMMIR